MSLWIPHLYIMSKLHSYGCNSQIVGQGLSESYGQKCQFSAGFVYPNQSRVVISVSRPVKTGSEWLFRVLIGWGEMNKWVIIVESRPINGGFQKAEHCLLCSTKMIELCKNEMPSANSKDIHRWGIVIRWSLCNFRPRNFILNPGECE